MAGSYTPTITTFTTPFLDVVSISSTSYEEIQESLGSDIYLAKNLLVEASSIIQLNEPISILTYDVDGNIFQDNVYNLADPFQYQTSYLQEFKNKGLILDGKSRIELILRPFSDMRLVFTAEEIVPDASDALDKIKTFIFMIDKLEKKIDNKSLSNKPNSKNCTILNIYLNCTMIELSMKRTLQTYYHREILQIYKLYIYIPIVILF
jgi:hypothetical protein